MRIISLLLILSLIFASNADALNISRLDVNGLRIHSDFGSEPPPPVCFNNGHSCSINTQCCSGNCLSSVCSVVIPPSSKPLLCPLGDSITRGSNDSTCQGQPLAGPTTTCFGYRDHLQDLLGVGKYNFVGDFKEPSTSPTYDTDHAGVPGQTTAQILARLPGILSTNFVGPVPAGSIFLIHAGTNDIRLGGSQSVAINNILTMINIINTYDPNITIYVALVTPYSSQMTSFNVALKSALITRQGTKSNLHYVDMEAAFRNIANCNPTYLICMNDGLHPDDVPPDPGYPLMARTWYNCIMDPTHQYCDGH